MRDEVILSIVTHVSRAMLSRYSQVRMEAKRRALDEIAARQRTANERRCKEAKNQQIVAISNFSDGTVINLFAELRNASSDRAV